LQSKAWTTSECVYLVRLVYLAFCTCDLDLDPLTLTYKLDLYILKMYLQTKIEVCRSRLWTVRVRTGQTDTQTDTTEHITK